MATEPGPSSGGANLSAMTAFSNSANFNKFIDQVPKHLTLLDQTVHTLQTRVDTTHRSFVQAIGELTTKHTAEAARLERELHTISLAITNQLQYLSQNSASLGGDFGNVTLGSKDAQMTALIGRKVLAPHLDVHGNFSLYNDALSTTVPIFSVSTSGVVTATSLAISGGDPISIASGGTNSSTTLQNRRVLISIDGRIVESDALSDGDFIIGATGASPAVGSLSSTNLTVTKSAGGLAINAPQDLSSTSSPSFAGVSLASPLPATSGGTGVSEFTTGDLLAGTEEGVLAVVPSNKTVLKKFLSQTGTGAASVAPSWITLSAADLTGDIPGRAGNVTGIVAVANGGTNSSTALNGDRIMVSASGAIREAPALLAGQFLAGSDTGVPTVTTLSGTAKRVLVALANGLLTLSTPQDIDIDSIVQFAGLILSSLEAGSSGTLTIGATSATGIVNFANGSTPTVLNFGGGAGQATINIGGDNDIVNLKGTVNSVNFQNSYVQDLTFTLNKNGAAGTGGGAGINVEENSIITAYWHVSNDRSSILMKAPNSVVMAFNQSLSTTDSAAFAALALTAALPVSSGGTGFKTFTFGDLLFGNNTSGLSVLAGNIGTGRLFLSQTGTGTVSAAPSWSSFALSDFSGLTFAVGNGGTGRSSYTIGDILVASSTSALGILNASAGAGNVMLSAAVGSMPTFGKVALTTHVSGTLPASNGGTGFNSFTLGQLLYANGTTTLTRLNGNSTTTLMFLTQTGTGAASAAPAWTALSLSGEASGAFDNVVLSNSAVLAKLLTGFAAAAGTVSASDSILQALQKVVGTLGAPTSANAFGEIVRRDSSGNIAVTQVTGSVSGSASTFTTALTGDVTGGANGGTTTVAQVGGKAASAVASTVTAVAAATDAKTGGALVLRTAGGAASLDVIGNLTGNASGSASTFTTALTGDVVGGASGGSTTVSSVGGKSAASIASATTAVEAATDVNTGGALVRRSIGGAAALDVVGSLTGNASTATAFTTALTGDVTGGANGGTTTVSQVGGKAASAVASTVTTVAAATDVKTGGTLVLRTAGGAASLDVIGNLTGNASGSAATFTTALTGDVSGGANGGTTTVNTVGSKAAAAVASGTTTVEAATDLKTGGALVKRTAGGAASLDVIGNLTGNASGSAATFTTALTGDCTGGANGGLTTVATVGGQAASAVATATTKVTNATALATGNTLALRDVNGSAAFTSLTSALKLSGSLTLYRTTFSNANISPDTTNNYVAQVGLLTAPRTLTLPTASSATAGFMLWVSDESGTASATNFITIATSGSDTLGGNQPTAIREPYGARVFMSNGTNKWTLIASTGATDQALYTNSTPQFGGLTLTTALPITSGGTNSSAALSNNRIMVSTAGQIREANALTDGQLLVGATGGAPVPASLTGTANRVTVVNAAGSITLSTPQDLHTAATPQFTGVKLKDAASAFSTTFQSNALTADRSIKYPDATGLAGEMLIADGNSNVNWSVPTVLRSGNSIVVDGVYGNDSTAARGRGAYLTWQAAITALQANDVLEVAPAVYAISSTLATGLTLAVANVHIIGKARSRCVINYTVSTATHTSAFTFAQASTFLENLTLNVTFAAGINPSSWISVVFTGTTHQTSRVRNCGVITTYTGNSGAVDIATIGSLTGSSAGETSIDWLNASDCRLTTSATSAAAGSVISAINISTSAAMNFRVRDASVGCLTGAGALGYGATTNANGTVYITAVTCEGTTSGINGNVIKAGARDGVNVDYAGLRLQSSTTSSTTVGLAVPAGASSYTLTVPPNAGILGQAPITDGTGVLSFYNTWRQLAAVTLAANGTTLNSGVFAPSEYLHVVVLSPSGNTSGTFSLTFNSTATTYVNSVSTSNAAANTATTDGIALSTTAAALGMYADTLIRNRAANPKVAVTRSMTIGTIASIDARGTWSSTTPTTQIISIQLLCTATMLAGTELTVWGSD
jgi:hypothetical protein